MIDLHSDAQEQLAGPAGDALAIVAGAMRALQLTGVPADAVRRYAVEALSDDYQHLLAVTVVYTEEVYRGC